MNEQIWCIHWLGEVPEWTSAFWVCKPVNKKAAAGDPWLPGTGIKGQKGHVFGQKSCLLRTVHF